MSFRVIQVSDIHLSGSHSYNQAGWEACLRYINQTRPDLVVITGDHVFDDPDSDDERIFARRQLDRIAVPWRATPGNHDIGDCHPAPYMGQQVTEERLARYVEAYGADRWSLDLGSWVLVGLNALLLGSNLKSEDRQRGWLRQTIGRSEGRPVGVFLHKPLCIDAYDEPDEPDICVSRDGRLRVLMDIGSADVRFVASGHTHTIPGTYGSGIPI